MRDISLGTGGQGSGHFSKIRQYRKCGQFVTEETKLVTFVGNIIYSAKQINTLPASGNDGSAGAEVLFPKMVVIVSHERRVST